MEREERILGKMPWIIDLDNFNDHFHDGRIKRSFQEGSPDTVQTYTN